MIALDIDLDFFVSPIDYSGGAHGRLSSEKYAVQDEEFVTHFLLLGIKNTREPSSNSTKCSITLGHMPMRAPKWM